MKWFLVFWLGPIVFLGGWYGLSYYDMNFGFFMLTRQAHELVLQMYAETLGIDPQSVAPLVAKAIGTDSLFVIAILIFRRRKKIAAWWQARRAQSSPEAALRSDDNLSNAPWRMKDAAAESIRSARLALDTSISSSARSAATVESRSSQ